MKSYALCELRLLQDPDRFIWPRRRMSCCSWSVKSMGRSGLHDVPPPGDIEMSQVEVRASFSVGFYRCTR